VLEDREGVEMAVEDQPPAGPRGPDAADQALHPRRRFDDFDLDAGNLLQQRLGDLGDLLGVARWIGRGDGDQPLRDGNQPVERAVDPPGKLIAQGGHG